MEEPDHIQPPTDGLLFAMERVFGRDLVAMILFLRAPAVFQGQDVHHSFVPVFGAAQ